MGILLAWALGYVVGAHAGAESFDDVVRALREVRDSDEVRGLRSVLRTHLAHALRSTAEMLEPASFPPGSAADSEPADLLDRVRLMMKGS
jgi:hypothetical protein